MNHSIFDTVECEAWFRGLSYENYLLIQKQMIPDSSPLSEQAYVMICDVFECDMENASNY